MLCFLWCLPDQHAAYSCHCLSGGLSCLTQVRTRLSGYQGHFCTPSTCGRKQRSHPVSSGALSSPHWPLSGRNIYHRYPKYQGRLNKHCLLFYQNLWSSAQFLRQGRPNFEKCQSRKVEETNYPLEISAVNNSNSDFSYIL